VVECDLDDVAPGGAELSQIGRLVFFALAADEVSVSVRPERFVDLVERNRDLERREVRAS
jgi:hypothetical protein